MTASHVTIEIESSILPCKVSDYSLRHVITGVQPNVGIMSSGLLLAPRCVRVPVRVPVTESVSQWPRDASRRAAICAPVDSTVTWLSIETTRRPISSKLDAYCGWLGGQYSGWSTEWRLWRTVSRKGRGGEGRGEEKSKRRIGTVHRYHNGRQSETLYELHQDDRLAAWVASLRASCAVRTTASVML